MTFQKRGYHVQPARHPRARGLFSEDTYRTLTAVDSAVMVIDAAQAGSSPRPASCSKSAGCARCRSSLSSTRSIARAAARSTLIDEVADALALDVCADVAGPWGWAALFERPARFRQAGAISRPDRRFSREFLGRRSTTRPTLPADAIAEEVELARGGYPGVRSRPHSGNGDLTPVYFGSALKEFRCRPADRTRLARFRARTARAATAERTGRDPSRLTRDEVTGLRVQGPGQHGPAAPRPDRLHAPVCRARSSRGMKLTPSGLRQADCGALSDPVLRAGPRDSRRAPRPGDIIGIPNHGTLRVGDTLELKKMTCASPGCPTSRPKFCAALF